MISAFHMGISCVSDSTSVFFLGGNSAKLNVAAEEGYRSNSASHHLYSSLAEQNANCKLCSSEISTILSQISTILSQNLRIFLPELVPNDVTVQGNNFSLSPGHFHFFFFFFLWQFYFLSDDFINLERQLTH